MKLTKTALDKFIYEREAPAKDIRWDSTLSGFGVRIYPTGRKTFVVFYRADGRQRLMTLGQYGVLTLDQARDLAKRKLSEVIEGGDPLATKQQAAAGETVKALCETYMERHARPHKKSWKEDEQRIDRRIIPAWGNLKASSLRRNDVAMLHSKVGEDHPYEANQILALLSRMFDLARRWGFVPEDFPNPARDIDKFKEQKRDRWVTPEELPKLAEAIDNEQNPVASAALWMYLLTGARKSELLSARWEDVDLERRELCFRDTKAGRTHYLPLNEPALAVLRSLGRLEGNPYIFPGHKQGAHLVNISKPWNRVRKAAGVEDVRLHDLRRTVGSWLAQAGNSLHLIGRVLNHSNQSTTAVYARFGEDHVRQALEAHGKLIMGVAGKTDQAEVIPIKKA